MKMYERRNNKSVTQAVVSGEGTHVDGMRKGEGE
jgi:hypothetical protein